MRRGWLIFLLFVTVLGCGVAHADTYVYDFHFDGDGLWAATDISYTKTDSGPFTYLSGSVNGYAPSTIALQTFGPGVVFDNGSLFGNGAPGTIVDLLFELSAAPGGPGVYTTDHAGRDIATADGSNFFYSDGTLTITDQPATVTSATPEPGTWMLVGSGLLGVAGASRRRMRLASWRGW